MAGAEIKHQGSGILLSMSAFEPPDELVTPLKPQMFRLRPTSAVERAAAMNAKVMVLVSDSYAGQFLRGYADGGARWPGDDGNWGPWEEHCTKLAQEMKHRRLAVIWDLWNEPSTELFWKRSVDQWHETWKRGVLAIRRIDPKAIISGPGHHAYNRESLVAFLRYAQANRVLPSIVNWHELGRPHQLVEHVADARESMKRLGINIDRIMIPEVIAADRQFQPGHAVGFIAAVHRANVEAVCHACWGENNGDLDPTKNAANNCENDSLDGLLSFGNKRPRSAWWAYRAYGSLAGKLAAVRVGIPFADAIATNDVGSHRAGIVFGRFEEDLSLPPKHITFEVRSATRLHASGAKNSDNTLRVVARSIPDKGSAPLDEPQVVYDERVPLRANAVRFTLPNVNADHAFWISVERNDVAPSLATPLDGAAPLQVGKPVTTRSPGTTPGKPAAFVFQGRATIETRLKRFFPATLEAWVKPQANEKDVFVIGSSSASYQGVGLGMTNGHLRAQFIAGDFGSSARVPAGEWSHIAAVHDNHETRLYVNGKQVAQGPPNRKRDEDSPIFVVGDIGKDYSGHHFQGLIRCLRISRGARYGQDFKPSKTFAHAPQEEGVASALIYDASVTRKHEAVDVSGNNNHGVLIGVTTSPLAPE